MTVLPSDPASTWHVVLVYDDVDDSITCDFQGTPAALARAMVTMAYETMCLGGSVLAVEDEVDE